MALSSVGIPKRNWVIPSAIAANALALLFFRHVVSLDGPMHLLHASDLHDALFGEMRHAQGIQVSAQHLRYDLLDLVVALFTTWVHPFLLHKLMAVLSITIVAWGAWRLTKAYHRPVNPSWLLILPLSFGFVLVLGLFHFILSAGVAFLATAWWIRQPHINRRLFLILVALAATCTFTHKAGGVLLIALIMVHECAMFTTLRVEWRERWAALPAWFLPAIATISLGGGLWIAAAALTRTPLPPHDEHHPLKELLTLRALLLVDSQAERGMRIAFACVLLGLCVIAVLHRWKNARSPRPSDVLAVLTLLLALASMLNTHGAELLYITDRAQWLSLLLLACWLSIQTMPRQLLVVAGCVILGLHAVRLIYIERRMNLMEPQDSAALTAARCLDDHALVIPAVLSDDWLMHHASAYTALLHRGIIFTGRHHEPLVWDRRKNVFLPSQLLSPENDWSWMEPHIKAGLWPQLDQVLVIGQPASGNDPKWNTLRATLRAHYHPVCLNDHVQVWSLR